MKRLLSCTASDFDKMDGKQLKQAIAASEGRVVLSEVIPTTAPLFGEVSNAELTVAFGADLVLLNHIDLFHPRILGWESEHEFHRLQEFKHMLGRPLGVNLEPVDDHADAVEDLAQVEKGRLATDDTFHAVKQAGLDFVCLTGNPQSGVTNEKIGEAIKTGKRILGDDCLIIAGKMHGSGIAGEGDAGILTKNVIDGFAIAGADIILFPSPGTVPGVDANLAGSWVKRIKENGCLAMSAIGTSQEGADEQTIRQIALYNKMIGADIHHIGDGGYTGVAAPENIIAYSIAIRGRRHTYIRMARR
ncbi:haloacid dehalogenase-like hydrolase [Virgibacillus halophilus]|uniref:Haloacid dehalogenase-like hydrolase n=1 Tax=Tigheibacillus halophilus TaxID=361280 RepID=A0ABU5C3A9_9BACI|nr:haloacid dehalogenase-like hydrolase [Virgibacillus halophilus]